MIELMRDLPDYIPENNPSALNQLVKLVNLVEITKQDITYVISSAKMQKSLSYIVTITVEYQVFTAIEPSVELAAKSVYNDLVAATQKYPNLYPVIADKLGIKKGSNNV